MSIRRMSREDFETLRKLYANRLHELRHRIILVSQLARDGRKDPFETLQEMEEIDQEVKGIIECGQVMVNLRRG